MRLFVVSSMARCSFSWAVYDTGQIQVTERLAREAVKSQGRSRKVTLITAIYTLLPDVAHPDQSSQLVLSIQDSIQYGLQNVASRFGLEFRCY